MAYRQDKEKSLTKGKTVLELGAGGALNSFIAAINDAKNIVITDYPDKDLIENIEWNAKKLFPELVEQKKMSVIVCYYIFIIYIYIMIYKNYLKNN